MTDLVKIVYPRVADAIMRALRIKHVDAIRARELLREKANGEFIRWTTQGDWWIADITSDQTFLDRLQEAVKLIANIISDEDPAKFYSEESVITEDSVYVLTTAPIEYDWGYVHGIGPVTVVDYDQREKPYRAVVMVDRMRALQYQIPRYWSGLCTTFVIPEAKMREFLAAGKVEISTLYDVQLPQKR